MYPKIKIDPIISYIGVLGQCQIFKIIENSMSLTAERVRRKRSFSQFRQLRKETFDSHSN